MDNDFKTLQRQFANAIRYPKDSVSDGLASIESRRLKVYRDLFFNNVEGFISGTFPVLKSLVAEAEWVKLVRLFFQQHQAETPYFLEISEEFLAFLQHHHVSLANHGVELPAYALELAHWEWMELLADRMDTEVEVIAEYRLKTKDVNIDMCYSIQDAAWGVSYHYPVHKAAPGVALTPAITCLLIYRNADDQVGFVEVNPLSLALFEHLKSNDVQSLRVLLTEIAKDQGLPEDHVIAGGLEIAQQWRDLGILRLAVEQN